MCCAPLRYGVLRTPRQQVNSAVTETVGGLDYVTDSPLAGGVAKTIANAIKLSTRSLKFFAENQGELTSGGLSNSILFLLYRVRRFRFIRCLRGVQGGSAMRLHIAIAVLPFAAVGCAGAEASLDDLTPCRNHATAGYRHHRRPSRPEDAGCCPVHRWYGASLVGQLVSLPVHYHRVRGCFRLPFPDRFGNHPQAAGK
jgi:hypothetical protein